MQNAPVIYHTHPLTGEYLGSGQADPDPMDEQNWLIPAHAYLEAPPAFGKSEAAVRTKDGWQRVPDYRGTVYQTDTGEPVQHNELGPLPVTLTHRPRPTPDHRWAGSRWQLDKKLQEENLRHYAADLQAQLDAASEQALMRAAGSQQHILDYESAAVEASAFQAAGFPADDVPPLIAALAGSDRSPQEAAESILQEAARLGTARSQVRTITLRGKEAIRAAMAAGELTQAEAATEATLAELVAFPAL